ncbi:MAG TPA: GH25 family lysozyme, partial [Anaerolineaceae bacterium]|nr:GH25 family lysozyme [Anaerolineaceae bacterium]
MSNKNQPLGVDISSYNGKKFDTGRLKQTTAFAVVRAGISWGWEDPTFARNWQGLKGHNRAAYHVVYPSQDAISQAQHFLEIVQKAGADWEHDRLALDLELAQGQSKARITQVTLDMMEHIKARTGRYPILYSRAYWVNDHLYVNDSRLKDADWWVANYLKRQDPAPTPEHPGPPILPRGISKWLIHQTSERGIGANFGRRDGIVHIDLNRWNGTTEELNAYFGRGDVPPVVVEPEPEPEVLFRARVTARRGLIVRVGPDTKCLRIGINPEGTVLDVFEVKNGWYRISPINQEWSSGRYTERIEEPEPPAEPVDLGFMLWSQRDARWASDRMGASNITL